MTRQWRYYVYEVLDASGAVIYVGKGSGQRMHVSKRAQRGDAVRDVAWFRLEKDAYRYEAERISDVRPGNNKCRGGNGSIATPKRKPRLTARERLVEAIGARKYAARLWLEALNACLRAGIKFPGDVSKVDAIREVAYG